ncbi:hypothetical protein B296_00012630 [Ensete ventricosum]|uniref:Uncharacterized protein n=1 Tax=Ensete ventricosum TaxID=4639 RepID=A0A426ZAA6_ENSVE|nr:hypothetical protein B296_00012630 [Ensete ventricosum]
MRWEFAKRFAEGIGKLARNTLGDYRRKTMRLATEDSEGCRNVGVVLVAARVSVTAVMGIAWKDGYDRDGPESRNMALIPYDRYLEGAL